MKAGQQEAGLFVGEGGIRQQRNRPRQEANEKRSQ
jgi:hypothetical protein